MDEKQIEEDEMVLEQASLCGVIIIGAPGTGKTTFCNALQQFLEQLDRKHALINLDPANENMEYKCTIDIQELISLEEVMEEYKLGPNGSMIYCMEFLQTNIDWLIGKIKEVHAKTGTKYFVFDLPGQVEIYSNHKSLKEIIQQLSTDLNMRMSALHLVDVGYLYDRNRFLSAMMLSLTAIVGMEMPFINAITKVDLMKKLGRPDMNLSFYNEIQGLNYLFYDAQFAETPFQKKYGKLTLEMCNVIDNFNLVQYTMVDITNKMLMAHILMKLDQANGYFLDPQKVSNPKEMEIDYESLKDYYEHEAIMDLEEKYLEGSDDGGNVEEDQEMKQE